MPTSTRPEAPVDRAAARRNFTIFSILSVLGVTALVAAIVLLLV